MQVPVDNMIVVPAPAAETQPGWDVTDDVYLSIKTSYRARSLDN